MSDSDSSDSSFRAPDTSDASFAAPPSDIDLTDLEAPREMVEEAILRYLRRHGYKKTASMFELESPFVDHVSDAENEEADLPPPPSEDEAPTAADIAAEKGTTLTTVLEAGMALRVAADKHHMTVNPLATKGKRRKGRTDSMIIREEREAILQRHRSHQRLQTAKKKHHVRVDSYGLADNFDFDMNFDVQPPALQEPQQLSTEGGAGMSNEFVVPPTMDRRSA
ncbi:MAG: hypothetical protein MHM6MM_003641 [Cercozoa sp. M6MM]